MSDDTTAATFSQRATVTPTNGGRIASPSEDSPGNDIPPQHHHPTKSYYAVRHGKGIHSAIFLKWEDCRPHVEGYAEAQYCLVNNLEQAEAYLEQTEELHQPLQAQKKARPVHPPATLPIPPPSRKRSRTETQANSTATLKSQKIMPPVIKAWTTESYHVNPPSEQWWELYFFLNRYKTTYHTMTLTEENVIKLLPSITANTSRIRATTATTTATATTTTIAKFTAPSKRHRTDSFTIFDFWKWIATHVQGYKSLTLDQRQNSIKVKRLSDLGFDFEMTHPEPAPIQDISDDGHQSRPNTTASPTLNNSPTVKVNGVEHDQHVPIKEKPHPILVPATTDSRPSINSPTANSPSSSLSSSWNDMYQKCVAYQLEHGHCNIPANAVDNEHKLLHNWLLKVKQQLHQQQQKQPESVKGGQENQTMGQSLTKEQVQKLQSLSIDWDGTKSRSNDNTGEDVNPNKGRVQLDDSSWEDMLQRLKQHYDKYKTFDVRVPTTSADEEEVEDSVAIKSKKDLAAWLSQQNAMYAAWRDGSRSTTMTEEKIESLAKIGYQLEDNYISFDHRLQQLRTFVEKHGNRRIPKNHDLFKWTRNMNGQLQRWERGKDGVTLTAEQIRRLKETSYFHDKNADITANEQEMEDRKWDEMYEQLKAYKEQHGDCLISTSNFTDPLVKWTTAQRRYYRTLKEKGKSKHLDARKLQLLHEIGFVFRQKRDYMTFEERLDQLRQFKEKHGHLRVPTNQQGAGAFVAHCRDQYRLAKQGKKHSMNEEKFQLLRELGFEFQVGKSPAKNFPRHSWEERFQQLVAYKAEFGNTIVPQHYSGYNNLGQWVKTQRENYRQMRRGNKTAMTSEMALRLNDLGFAWEVTQSHRKRDEADATTTTAPTEAKYSEDSLAAITTEEKATMSKRNDSESSSDNENPPRRFFCY